MFKFILTYMAGWRSTRSMGDPGPEDKRGNQSQAVFNSLLLGFMTVIHLGQVVIFKNLSCHQSMCMHACVCAVCVYVGDFVGYFPPSTFTWFLKIFFFFYHAWLASTLTPESMISLGSNCNHQPASKCLRVKAILYKNPRVCNSDHGSHPQQLLVNYVSQNFE